MSGDYDIELQNIMDGIAESVLEMSGDEARERWERKARMGRPKKEIPK